jgi:hypothetical protein
MNGLLVSVAALAMLGLAARPAAAAGCDITVG